MEKYKILKRISAVTVWNAGDKFCDEFRDEYTNFLVWLREGRLGLTQNLDNFISSLTMRPKWKQFLLDSGFIEKEEEEKYYYVGQRFKYIRPDALLYGTTYKLVGNNNCVELLNEATNSWWISPGPNSAVNNARKISSGEFDRMTGDQSIDFKVIGGEDDHHT